MRANIVFFIIFGKSICLYMEKKLFRSRKDKVLAGVCGGFAEYFNIKDTTWVRLIWALLTFAAGISIWIYVICCLVMPLEPESTGKVDWKQ